MFGSSPRNAVNAYSKISMETGVLAADPHKLVVMLFDGAIIAIGNARQQMELKKIPEKGKSISHAIAIIENGLRASLNKKVGGELALNLDYLYAYIVKELLLANINNDVTKLDESQRVLKELRGAWEQIAPDKLASQVLPTTAVDLPEPKREPKDLLAPRKSSHIAV